LLSFTRSEADGEMQRDAEDARAKGQE